MYSRVKRRKSLRRNTFSIPPHHKVLGKKKQQQQQEDDDDNDEEEEGTEGQSTQGERKRALKVAIRFFP